MEEWQESILAGRVLPRHLSPILSISCDNVLSVLVASRRASPRHAMLITQSCLSP